MRAHQSGRAMADIRDRHVILALACLAQFVVLLVVYSVGALAPLLRDALHLSREQIGSLTTLFFLGAILASIPVGWLADRLGVRGVLISPTSPCSCTTPGACQLRSPPARWRWRMWAPPAV